MYRVNNNEKSPTENDAPNIGASFYNAKNYEFEILFSVLCYNPIMNELLGMEEGEKMQLKNIAPKYAVASSVLATLVMFASPTVAHADLLGQYLSTLNSNPTVSTIGGTAMGASTAGSSQISNAVATATGLAGEFRPSNSSYTTPDGLVTTTHRNYLGGFVQTDVSYLNSNFRQEYKNTVQMLQNPNYVYSKSTAAFIQNITASSVVPNSPLVVGGEVSVGFRTGGFVPGAVTVDGVNLGLNAAVDNNGTITVVQNGIQAQIASFKLLQKGQQAVQQAQNANCSSQLSLSAPADSRFAWAYTAKTVCKPSTVAKPVYTGGTVIQQGGAAAGTQVAVGLSDGVTQGTNQNYGVTQGNTGH